MDSVHIAFAGNSKVFKGVLLSTMSMIKHTNRVLNIHILTMDLTDMNKDYSPINNEMVELLNKIVKEKNINSSVVSYDVSKYYLDTIANSKNNQTSYTPYTFLRLYMTKLDGIGEKVIYIDVDTMINNDIGQMYDIDLLDYEFAAVKDHMGKIFINRTYCNAGVLFLNLKRIKETNLFEKCIEMILVRKMGFPDQTAINDLALKKMFLPRKYNEQRKIHDDTVIKHFCQGIKWFPIPRIYNIKQWEIDKVHEKMKIFMYDDIFTEYKILCEEYPFIK